MTLNYPLYRVHNNARLLIGSLNNTSIAYTKGPPQFTGAEFHHLLRYIRDVMGFHVYANSHFGGIHLTAHGPNSWHYVKDGAGRSLGADIGTHRDIDERRRIINELIPVLDRIGVAWVYARDGHVANHYDHIHIDVGCYGNKGGTASNWYGYYRAYRKANPITALPIGRKRKPKSILAGVGARGDLTRTIQRIVGTTQDGIYGPATANGVRNLQRRLKVGVDGTWGPQTARAYVGSVSNRRLGSTGGAVRIIQYIAAVPIDGIFGQQTHNAVVEMQHWGGLVPDGIFGPASRNKLLI